MCTGLNYLHTIGIVHRDLKLENFMFADDKKQKVKIIDFGLSKYWDSKPFKAFKGTPYYVSPEVLRKIEITDVCDEWSLGICLYRMLTAEYPFNGQDFDDLFNNIQNADYDRSLLSNLSPEVREIITGLL